MFRIAIAFASLFLLGSCASAPSVSPQVRSELAPTGKLRVGINYGNPLFAVRDKVTGEGSGIAIDLARELGRRMGVPVALVGYDSGGRTAAGVKSGWEVTFLAYEQTRENEITFAAAFAEIDATYLVPAGSKLRNAAEVDREGTRVVTSAGGGNDLFLTRTLKHARLVRAPTPSEAYKLFVADKLDAFAGLKPTLIERAANLPGSRVLDGRYTVIPYSAGVPKGHDAGARYVRDFIEDAKASGFVARSIEKNGIRGVSVPLPAPTVQMGGGM